MTVVQGLASDITLVPSSFIDASAIPVMGGIVQIYEVEVGEEVEGTSKDTSRIIHKNNKRK